MAVPTLRDVSDSGCGWARHVPLLAAPYRLEFESVACRTRLCKKSPEHSVAGITRFGCRKSTSSTCLATSVCSMLHQTTKLPRSTLETAPSPARALRPVEVLVVDRQAAPGPCKGDPPPAGILQGWHGFEIRTLRDTADDAGWHPHAATCRLLQEHRSKHAVPDKFLRKRCWAWLADGGFPGNKSLNIFRKNGCGGSA